MNITNAQYKNDRDGNPACIVATIDGVEWFVPLDTANAAYKEMMRQSEEGTLTISADTENLFVRMEAGELAIAETD